MRGQAPARRSKRRLEAEVEVEPIDETVIKATNLVLDELLGGPPKRKATDVSPGIPDPKRAKVETAPEPVISDPSGPGVAKPGAVPEIPAGDVEITTVEDQPEDVVPTVPQPQPQIRKRPREEDEPEPTEAPAPKQPRKEESPPQNPQITQMQGVIQDLKDKVDDLTSARDKDQAVQIATLKTQLAEERARESEEEIPVARPASTRERSCGTCGIGPTRKTS